MTEKTHTTAVVLIPPEEVWGPIQEIRRTHDKQVQRWMPHVTLLYPFRPPERFDEAAAALGEACRAVEPFNVELRRFGWFPQGPKGFTIYLVPGPVSDVWRLHEALWRAMPDCDDVHHYKGGFQAHLSVGQFRGDEENLRRLVRPLAAGWQAVRFRAESVSIIRRDEPPDDVFRVDRTIPLGT